MRAGMGAELTVRRLTIPLSLNDRGTHRQRMLFHVLKRKVSFFIGAYDQHFVASQRMLVDRYF